jgi:cytochrome c oxidase subunit 2
MTDGKERKVVSDEVYLRKSILEPNADVVKGFPPIMSPQKMTEDEINELINYIKELK